MRTTLHVQVGTMQSVFAIVAGFYLAMIAAALVLLMLLAVTLWAATLALVTAIEHKDSARAWAVWAQVWHNATKPLRNHPLVHSLSRP